MYVEDPHTLSFNISSRIGSTTRIPILFLQDYEVWDLHFEDYVLGIEDHGMMIWQAITEGTFMHMGTRRTIKKQAEYNTLHVDVKDIPQDEKDKLLKKR